MQNLSTTTSCTLNDDGDGGSDDDDDQYLEIRIQIPKLMYIKHALSKEQYHTSHRPHYKQLFMCHI